MRVVIRFWSRIHFLRMALMRVKMGREGERRLYLFPLTANRQAAMDLESANSLPLCAAWDAETHTKAQAEDMLRL
jgi:hypothetical protein